MSQSEKKCDIQMSRESHNDDSIKIAQSDEKDDSQL